VKVWHAATGKEALTLKGHTGLVWSVVFSPDGQRLAASDDMAVKVWDAATSQQALTLKGQTSLISSVAFSPDGRRPDWASWPGDDTKGRIGPDRNVAFSPDGKRLASASQDNTVRVWDAATGQEPPPSRGTAPPFRSRGRGSAGCVTARSSPRAAYRIIRSRPFESPSRTPPGGWYSHSALLHQPLARTTALLNQMPQPQMDGDARAPGLAPVGREARA
jgi:WD40 repeat protein